MFVPLVSKDGERLDYVGMIEAFEEFQRVILGPKPSCKSMLVKSLNCKLLIRAC